MHGGGPDVVAGKPLDYVYKEEAIELVKVSFVAHSKFGSMVTMKVFRLAARIYCIISRT